MRTTKVMEITLAGVMLFLGACATPAIKKTEGAAPAAQPSARQVSATLKPAVFVTRELTVSTVECTQGADVWVGVTVKNIGGQPGTYPVVVKLNGVEVRTGNVTLNAGAAQNVYFVLNQKSDMPEFTSYKVSIDNLEKDVLVL